MCSLSASEQRTKPTWSKSRARSRKPRVSLRAKEIKKLRMARRATKMTRRARIKTRQNSKKQAAKNQLHLSPSLQRMNLTKSRKTRRQRKVQRQKARCPQSTKNLLQRQQHQRQKLCILPLQHNKTKRPKQSFPNRSCKPSRSLLPFGAPSQSTCSSFAPCAPG